MRRNLGLLMLPLWLAASACDNEPIDPVTGGEGSGSTGFSVIVTDDPANDPGTGGSPASTITGELNGAVRVALRNDAGALVDLGLSDDAAILLQQGGDSVRLSGIARPPADTYTAIQLQFEGATVTVNQGSEVGDSTLTQDAVLGVGAGGFATVEIATLPFDVVSETTLRIVTDLNAEQWITTTNLVNAGIPQADLANNVTVEVE